MQLFPWLCRNLRRTDSVKEGMKQRAVIRAAAVILIVMNAACAGDEAPPQLVTIPSFVGRNAAGARDLANRHGLSVTIRSGESSPAGLSDAVMQQKPPPGTRVERGSEVTLLLHSTLELGPGEELFRLTTHCGLSYPLKFDGQAWLPTDKRLRRTINPPRIFGLEGGIDFGTVRRVDRDTLIYKTSSGHEIEYEPTNKRVGPCA